MREYRHRGHTDILGLWTYGMYGLGGVWGYMDVWGIQNYGDIWTYGGI